MMKLPVYECVCSVLNLFDFLNANESRELPFVLTLEIYHIPYHIHITI